MSLIVKWCDENFLDLNVRLRSYCLITGQTVVIEVNQKPESQSEGIQIVEICKYLGTVSLI